MSNCKAPDLKRVYLYGVIEDPGQATLACAGVGCVGVDGTSQVRVVAHQGLGCVVSDYRGEEFAAMSKERLVRSLLAHQQVVERAMQSGSVLPVKFGTLLASLQEVQTVLAQGHAELAEALASIHARVEIEVAATWDTSRVLQEIAGDEAVRQARDALACGNGQPTLAERVRLGQMVKGQMDKRREGYRERILGDLRRLAVDAASNALLSDEMVVNEAFLLDTARQHEFCQVVHKLDDGFPGELAFRVIGPLPPYSFSTVEIERLTTDQVEAARRTLQLGDGLTEAQVKDSYRQLAAWEQRRLLSGEKVAHGRLTGLRQAAALLLRYARARDGLGNLAEDVAQRDLPLFGISIAGAGKGPGTDEVEPSQFGVRGSNVPAR